MIGPPGGKQIVVNAAHGDGDNNWYFPNLDVIDVSSGKLQTLLKPEFQINILAGRRTGSRSHFLGGLMAGDLVGNYGDVYVVPTADGQARNLTANWPASAYRIGWLPPNEILIREVEDGDVGLVTLDMNGTTKRLWKGADHSSQGGALDEISVAQDRNTTVVVLRSLADPPELWVSAIGTWCRLSHFNDNVHPKPEKIESLQLNQ
jgi:hypothetical protein